MSAQAELNFESASADADLLAQLEQKADLVLIKKMANNDRDWADHDNKHQGGVYIPVEQRDGGFFPPLIDTITKRGASVREATFRTIWPQVGGEDTSRLVNYTSKGPETHMTNVPKEAFAGLLPASFLVMGRMSGPDGYEYECLTIDSGSDEASLLTEMFGFDADFVVEVFDPAAVRAKDRDRVLDFADRVIAAWLAGEIASFARGNAAMPATAELARLALRQYLDTHGLETLNPFKLDHPGDVLREISRSIEWDLFREYQRRERAVELVRLVLGDATRTYTASDIIRRLVDGLPGIDAIMLSASQQRKSRAGYSYEHHIETMLLGGSIPFEKQAIVDAKKRPDFILPSLAWIDGETDSASTGLILSAKTTLRERWKQVEREKGSRRLFLTTVDENIAGNAIEDMASFGVHLVIPESLLKSKMAEYAGHSNVLGFREFCEVHVRPHLTAWKSAVTSLL